MRWLADERHDIESAVSEALTNVVEHAYDPEVEPGTETVTATVGDLPARSRRVRVCVFDGGRRRARPDGPPDRRFRLRLMCGLMDTLLIDDGEPGQEHR